MGNDIEIKGGCFFKSKVTIGIDTGVNTGLAIYDPVLSVFLRVDSVKILEAMRVVLKWRGRINRVVVEDARQVKFKTSRYKAQGAGSVKRDCQIWQDFLEENGIPYEMVRPNKKITKLDQSLFKRLSGWDGRTNEHSRDAAMLVLNSKA